MSLIRSVAAPCAEGLLAVLVAFTLNSTLRGQPQGWTNGPSPSLVTTTSTGNVGIGLASGTAPLISLDVRTGSLPQMGIAGTTDYLTFFASDTFGPAIYWDPAKDMRFGKGGSGLFNPQGFIEQMRIQSSTGNVGIGTPTPSGRLDVFLSSSDSNQPPLLTVGKGTDGNYLTVTNGGAVGIGTTSPQHLLGVNGTIGAIEVTVVSSGADYVFEPEYNLRPLKDVAQFIRENKHLPDMPPAEKVQKDGMSVGDMETKLLAKVEELTLHLINAEQRSDKLEEQNRALESRLAEIEIKLSATQQAHNQSAHQPLN